MEQRSLLHKMGVIFPHFKIYGDTSIVTHMTDMCKVCICCWHSRAAVLQQESFGIYAQPTRDHVTLSSLCNCLGPEPGIIPVMKTFFSKSDLISTGNTASLIYVKVWVQRGDKQVSCQRLSMAITATLSKMVTACAQFRALLLLKSLGPYITT